MEEEMKKDLRKGLIWIPAIITLVLGINTIHCFRAGEYTGAIGFFIGALIIGFVTYFASKYRKRNMQNNP